MSVVDGGVDGLGEQAAEAFVHEALFYDDLDGFASGTLAFVRGGLEAAEPALVAVPAPHIAVLREALGGDAAEVGFVDMHQFGRNPSRIIPAVRDWVDEQAAERVRFVGEPIWPERRPCETLEATRHEALINLAFADTASSILCPYDARRLEAHVLADAEQTHPVLVCGEHRRPSPAYADPLHVYAAAAHPLPPPPGPVDAHPVTADLGSLRRFVATHAAAANLEEAQREGLVLAVNEAATNSLLHSGGRPGVVRTWREAGALICEICDGGRIADPLAGRRRPSVENHDGRGLWLINQLCDLVELRAEPDGTTLRLHMQLA
jgi:anti-sigma regulatory factor (Ser/Thr protein kinase)